MTAKETNQLKEVQMEAVIPLEEEEINAKSAHPVKGIKISRTPTRASGGIISTFKTHGMGPNPIEKANKKTRRLTWLLQA